MNNYEDLDNLHRAMAGHDWWYQYSDDHSVWSAGMKAMGDIGRRAHALGEAGSMLHREWTQHIRTAGSKVPVMPSDRPNDDPLLEQWRKQTEPSVRHCQKCGDTITGHEDDGQALCRWCVAGWKPESSSTDTVDDKKV